MRLSVAEITKAVDGKCVCTDASVEGVNWDSRVVKPGDMYVALPGERVDGHDFIEAAAAAGAACALVSREVDASIPVIVVDDTAAALTRLSAYWRGKLEGVVIGLTGSVGKTSTKNLVRDVLSHARSVVATVANQNNELGVPNTLLAADVDTQAIVVEMGMRGQGQITELCEIARPDWGIITNVGESHIELLGSRDNIARAKAELFEGLPDGRGIAFVNAADDYAGFVCEHAKLVERGITTVFYGGASASDNAPSVWASEVEFDSEGRPSFVLNAQNVPVADEQDALSGLIACKLDLRGAHSVTNACAAAAVGLVGGMTLEQGRDALAAAQPEKGRQQITRTQA
ncbi:MAG: UDP-N-acetylmuramoyl-tripeptide--D-alanyl-D-alanine ligase, partial [Eggerthellaceae bacterium]|nr:UDP-N-acetylmuramoyl-tripeptide--D-alanyl-D-alanine ligase [Eggerthellaceae bacterium]